MTVLESAHRALGALFVERGGRSEVAHYGRPMRAHRAVRNGVGVTERIAGVVVVEGDDRVAFVDDAVSNRVPEADGEACYAVLLDPDGRIRLDAYVFNAGERLLLFVPPGEAGPLAAEWSEKTFVQDIAVREATDEFATLDVVGPNATEKVASVLNGAATPETPLSFVRGAIDDRGVTVARTDAPAGEAGYAVVCAAEHADRVFDALVYRGLNAVPFGRRTWETLTLEAGTPLFEPDLRGRVPTHVGVRNALDFEKGCYVGQEVVARVENQGALPSRLVGLTLADAVEAGTAVRADGDDVGEVTRAVESPSLGESIAFAQVDTAVSDPETALTVGDASATVAALPFVDASERSARIPTYPGSS